jgi:hypothetical protein
MRPSSPRPEQCGPDLVARSAHQDGAEDEIGSTVRTFLSDNPRSGLVTIDGVRKVCTINRIYLHDLLHGCAAFDKKYCFVLTDDLSPVFSAN